MISDLGCYLIRLMCGATLSWMDTHPAAGPRIYYANHTSHLDFPLIWASLPGELRRQTRPIAARDYWDKSPLRRLLSSRVFRHAIVRGEFFLVFGWFCDVAS